MGVEALESRECPACASLYNGVLTVQGTDGDDTIVVSRNGNMIVAAGQSFRAAAVKRMVITAGAGDDVIRENSGLSAVIYGGQGDDTIYAGRGHDTIYGGHGDDRIYGNRGSDIIYGGSGNNFIDGGPGNNVIRDGSPQVVHGNTALESQIIQLINNYRTSRGLGVLKTNGQLNVAADLHSQDMVMISNQYGPWQGMQHELYGTSHPKPTDRLDAAGYDDWETYFTWGENIAFGYTTAAQVVQAWINSPSHRQNIVNGNFTETGVSVRVDSSGLLFFTQTFGTAR